MTRESYVFYRSFHEAMASFSDEMYGVMVRAISEYSLNGKEPELYDELRMVFTLIKPQIDANNKRFLDGQRGGRPKKAEKKPVVSEENNHRFSEKKPNVNVNVNVNDKDNVNENVNVYTEPTKIPDDFNPSASVHSWCKKQGWTARQVDDQLMKFIDYWDNQTGKRALKKNWDRAFQNWMNNAIEFGTTPQRKMMSPAGG